MLEEFNDFIRDLKLDHFQPDEFLVSTDRPGNSFPPQPLWPNLVATALILDQLRKHFGRPLVITSCYRAIDYNQQVGGTPRSNHQAFTATDFGIAGHSPAEVSTLLRDWRGRWFAAPAMIERVRVDIPDVEPVPFAELTWRTGASGEEFQFAGGVGEYSRFTHLDTRGLNHTWSGN